MVVGDATIEPQGCQLCDPDLAQHTSIIRTPNFVSEEEIALVVAEADAVRSAGGSMSARFKTPLYLQCDGLSPTLAPIFQKVCALVTSIDSAHWRLLKDCHKAIDELNGVNARCVEFHEYSLERGRRVCESHYDAGSLFTADIMLSDTGHFEGGDMTSTVWEGAAGGLDFTAASDYGGDESAHSGLQMHHAFEKGDCLVFLSAKHHSVGPMRSGTRRVLVIEFWDGPCCKRDHRCGDGWGSCPGEARCYWPHGANRPERTTNDEGGNNGEKPQPAPALLMMTPRVRKNHQPHGAARSRVAF